MAQIETPNYLGFLAQMPKESGLQSGIEHGIQTYGALQNIRGEKQRQELQEEKLKQEKATTKEMPGKKDREKQLEEQTIEQNKQTLSANAINLNDAKERFLENQLTDVMMYHDMDKDGKMGLAQKHYEESLEKAKALGVDISKAPKTWDSEAIMHGSIAMAKSPAAAAAREFENKKILEQIKASGKIEAERVKAVKNVQEDPYKKKFSEGQGTLDTNYLNKELPESASNAAQIVNTVAAMKDLLNKSRGSFGPGVGGWMSTFGETANTYKSLSSALQAAELKTLPGASRGTNGILKLAKDIKLDPSDPVDAQHKKLNIYETWAVANQEHMAFANAMAKDGITSRRAIEESWDKFINARTFMDKEGNANSSEVSKWHDWFADHPDALPSTLKAKIKGKAYLEETGQISQQGLNEKIKSLQGKLASMGVNIDMNDPDSVNKLMAMARGEQPIPKQIQPVKQRQQDVGNTLPASKPTRPVSVAYNNGVIPNYNPEQTPHNLLTGD